MADDFSTDTSTSGEVSVGGTASGNIETTGDRDWFAVDLVAGQTYTIELRGSPTADGTLSDPLLYGIHDADGNLIANTTNDDGGDGRNSKVTFTATESGTFYIAAGAYTSHLGTYEVEVTDTSAVDDTRAGATDLGDITALQGPRFPRGALDGDTDQVDYYRFTLTEAKRVDLGLRQQDADADLYLEDANGNVLYRSTNSGTDNERIAQTLLAGTYYLRVESQAAGLNAHVVRYGVSAPDADAVAALQEQSGTAVNEAPAFGEQGYAFALAENADGSTNRVSLGTVAATDPQGTTPAYSLVGGNESGSFDIDATSGELFYTGAGEDFESGTTQFTLTVRASDGSETADTTVTVNVTDVNETPTFAESYAFALAENADGSTNRVSLGTVAATDPEGATLTYSLAGGNESGSFEIDAASGELFYKGAGEDFESGTTRFTLTVRASDGSETTDTTVTVNVTDADEGDTRAGATDLGDITALQGPRFPRGTVDGNVDQVDYYRFTLAEAKRVGLGLRQQDADADLFLEDADGNVLYSSTNSGTDNEKIAQTLLAGTYYLRVESQAAGLNLHVVRYGVSAPDADELAALQEQSGTAVNEAPAFAEASYAFALAENADGSTNRMSLGTVAATDPEGATPVYSLVGDSGSFEIDAASGELFYAGAGEDFESGTTQFTLTVRASDGSETTDTTVTVNVTDVNETPTFADASYTFALEENADGSTNRVSLGTVAATDPEGATPVYSLVGDSGSFEIDAASGELFYAGAGEDFESGTTRFTLTVRASDGNLTTDTRVTVNVTDVDEVDPLAADGEQAAPQTVSEPGDEDFSANTSTNGRVAAGETATGAVGSGGDRDWFAVDLVAGRSYTIDLRGSPTDDGTLPDPYLRGIHDAAGNLIARTTNDDWGGTYNSRVTFTATETGTHYIAAGAFRSRQGTYKVEVTDSTPTTDVNEAPMIRVADAEATEGDDPEMLFRVTLESASSGTVTVNYATVDGTATAGEDYTAMSGTLTFAPGETEKTVSVAIIDDELEDSGETFTLVLSDPSGAVLEDDSEATGTILNTEDDYGQDTTTTGEVTVGGNVWGIIGNDADRDWFKVELTAGRLYQIDVQGKEQYPLGSNMVTDMCLLGVHDSAGDLIPGTTDSNSGWWRSPRLYFDPPATGTYFIAVGSNWGTGNYRVSVTDKGEDQSADTDTTGTVAVDGTATGVIPGTGDQDWFKVSLTAGTTYRIGIEARDGGQDGCLSDPALLGIHESDGDLIANTYDDNGGTGRTSLLEFTATATGAHFIAVGYGEHSLLRQSILGPGGGFGGYTVSVDEVDAM